MHVDVVGLVGFVPVLESDEQATIRNEDIPKMVEIIFLFITTP